MITSYIRFHACSFESLLLCMRKTRQWNIRMWIRKTTVIQSRNVFKLILWFTAFAHSYWLYWEWIADFSVVNYMITFYDSLRCIEHLCSCCATTLHVARDEYYINWSCCPCYVSVYRVICFLVSVSSYTIWAQLWSSSRTHIISFQRSIDILRWSN